jgi:kynurenine formamidase
VSQAQFADSGERLDARTVREWGRRYSNWRRFGERDEHGTLNFITRARVLAAASAVRSGLVVSCALPFGAHDDSREVGGPAGACWESLARVARDGRIYNDRDPAALPAAGARAASIDRFADGVVGRGVLLDLPRFVGRPWLDAGSRIVPADLDACAEAYGVTIETGDVLLVRTGRLARCFAEGWQDYADGPAPGLSLRCARWLYERQVAAVASDTACVEVFPAETSDCELPLHQVAVRDMGLRFGHTFHLDRLAEACAADGRYAFLFAAPPLPGTRAFEIPINPLAIK